MPSDPVRIVSQYGDPVRIVGYTTYANVYDSKDFDNDIQATIDVAEDANDSGIVLLPYGDVDLADTLVVSKRGIVLAGGGGAGNFDDDPDFGTVLNWTGAANGTMVRFTAISGASNYPLSHVGLMGVTLNCAGVADKGLELLSVREGFFSDIFIRNPDVVGLDMNVVASLVTSRDNQQNLFQRLFIRCVESGGSDAIGIRLDGDAVNTPYANTSLNAFHLIHIHHKDGIGIKLLNCDANEFYSVRLSRPSGSAAGVEFNGYSVSGRGHSRENTFYSLQPGAGGVVAKGVSLTQPSNNNAIYAYSLDNSSILPTVEAGAGLFVETTDRQRYVNGKLRAGDPKNGLFREDDFDAGSNTTATIGSLGWTLLTASLSVQAGADNHPGVWRAQVSAGQYAGLHLRANPAVGIFDADEDFDLTFVVKLVQTDASTTFRFGVGNDASANPPSNGIYVEKLAADSSWFGVTRSGGSENRTAALLASDTNWHTVRIRRVNSTTIGFTVDGGAEVTATATIPTADVQPFIFMGSSSGAKSFDIDYFCYSITGMAR